MTTLEEVESVNKALCESKQRNILNGKAKFDSLVLFVPPQKSSRVFLDKFINLL